MLINAVKRVFPVNFCLRILCLFMFELRKIRIIGILSNKKAREYERRETAYFNNK